MAFNFPNLKFSKTHFLSRSFDKIQKVRARNAVIEKHLEVENTHIKKLQDRDQRTGQRDRQCLIKAWKNSVAKKSPEPQEWLSRQKSLVWREQARERITKRGRRPGPIVPAHIFAHDGSCHQLFFDQGEMRQKALTGNGAEKEEFLSILPTVYQCRYYHRCASAPVHPRRSGTPRLESLVLDESDCSPPRSSIESEPKQPHHGDNNQMMATTRPKSSVHNGRIKKPGTREERKSGTENRPASVCSKRSRVMFEDESWEELRTVGQNDDRPDIPN